MGASGEGAETTTFLAPPLKCADAFSVEVKTPVDSTTYSAPAEAHGMAAGSLSLKTAMPRPLTDRDLPSEPTQMHTSFLRWNPTWVESYLVVRVEGWGWGGYGV